MRKSIIALAVAGAMTAPTAVNNFRHYNLVQQRPFIKNIEPWRGDGKRKKSRRI